jgi:hypothetical protein
MERRDLSKLAAVAGIFSATEATAQEAHGGGGGLRVWALPVATELGYVTRILSPVNSVFIRVAGGFDVVAWASGQA